MKLTNPVLTEVKQHLPRDQNCKRSQDSNVEVAFTARVREGHGGRKDNKRLNKKKHLEKTSFRMETDLKSRIASREFHGKRYCEKHQLIGTTEGKC